MVGQRSEFEDAVAVAVVVVVRVVVIVRAVGMARERVLVCSSRVMQVDIVVVVDVGPGQMGREVERGAMCGLR